MKTNNKIAYIVSAINGLEAFIYREIEYLEKKGLKIIIFTTKFKRNDIYSPKKNWPCYSYNIIPLIVLAPAIVLWLLIFRITILVEAIRFSTLPEAILATYYSYFIKKNKCQKIHCHFGDRKLFIGYFCKRILGLPLSVTIHSHEFWTNPNINFFKHIIPKTDSIITISEGNKNRLINNFRVNPNTIKVIRLFVDCDDYHKNDNVNVLTVGRFTWRKGYHILFKAIKLINRQNVKFIIVGFGDLDVRRLAEKYGVSDKVIIYNKMDQNQLKYFYNNSDIFCLPSIPTKKEGDEGIPVVLIEAMAYNLPIAASNCGDVSEIVSNILVKPNNPEKLAKALIMLIDNPTLRKKMGALNRTKILKYYNVKNINALYKHLINYE